ncbi:hypothetical protein EVAR_61789_1 [Eumeta japonica]|uniref:Uncharacterized protein n=1 Tax=Eumeta variegata TaxID=151549 RepID=A0A4C1SYR2_EUMVA|nr:hypothetical protein EVAR_61789_1 [Eumeta japonica]
MEPSSLNAGARSDLSHSGSVCRLYRPDSYSLGLHSQLRTPTICSFDSHTPSLAEVVNHVEPSVADVDITSVTEVVSSARPTGASVKNWGPLFEVNRLWEYIPQLIMTTTNLIQQQQKQQIILLRKSTTAIILRCNDCPE